MIDLILRVVVLGAIYSGVWALVSAGFTLVFGVGRIVNLSHGIFFLLGSYLMIAVFDSTGNIWIAMVASILFVGGVGAFVQKALIEKLDEMEMIIIVTLAFALFVQRIILRIYGHTPRSAPTLIDGTVQLGGIQVTYMSVVVLFSAFGILAALHLFITRTQLGAAIEATAQDTEVAKLVGIDVDTILVISMAVSGMLAALAGIFWTQLYTISPALGLNVLIYAFAIVILGGLGSVKGSIVGAFVVGYVATLVIQWQGVRYSYIAMLLVIIVTLVIKPSGLYGKEQRV